MLTITLFVLLCVYALPAKALDQATKDAFLNTHNQYRQAVGVGAVTWDDDAAAFAQQHANQCQWGHSQNSPYGENIHGDGPKTTDYVALAERAVNGWGGEKKYYDSGKSWECAFRSGQTTCGHYSQIVWKHSTAIGCGIANCASGAPSNFVVCSYNPPGNYRGQTPY